MGVTAALDSVDVRTVAAVVVVPAGDDIARPDHDIGRAEMNTVSTTILDQAVAERDRVGTRIVVEVRNLEGSVIIRL